MDQAKRVSIRCDDGQEVCVLSRYDWGDNDVGFEIAIEDSYCGGDYCGIKGRFRRAFGAFFAKPVCYASVCISDQSRLQEFLNDCKRLVD